MPFSGKLKKIFSTIVYGFIDLLPIQNNKIIFDNFQGRGFGDDPKYIAQELLKTHPELDLRWISGSPFLPLPKGIRPVPVYLHWVFLYYHLSTARVWVINNKGYWKPPKKKGQFYIQTWHSTLGYKRNEADSLYLDEAYQEVARKDGAITDLMYSDNDFRKKLYETRFWYPGKVLKCDVPRMGILLKPDPRRELAVRSYFSLGSQKIVLYAPTFRDHPDLSLYHMNFSAVVTALQEKFGGEYVFLLRLHPNEAALGKKLDGIPGIYNATGYPDAQELLACADALITDYSGLMFDMMLAEKPVFLYCRDAENYLTRERGAYFDFSELPASCADSEEGLLQNIRDFSRETYGKACTAFRETVGFQDNGEGAKQIAGIILREMGIE